MNDFLIKIKLIDHLTIKLPIGKIDFVNRLRNITEIKSTGTFISPFEAFSSSNKEFVGQVNHNGFKLRKKMRLFDTKPNAAIVRGTFKEDNDQLIVETEINGFRTFFYFFYGFLLLFYAVGTIGFIFSDEPIGFFIIPFLILHAALMFFLPYFVMRRSVKRLKYDLEREFFYLTR